MKEIPPKVQTSDLPVVAMSAVEVIKTKKHPMIDTKFWLKIADMLEEKAEKYADMFADEEDKEKYVDAFCDGVDFLKREIIAELKK